MVNKVLKTVSLVIFLLSIGYFIKDANLPFVGPFGNNNATYSIQGKNYIELGLLSTKFAPVNKIENNKPQYYLHHPPLLQLLTALSYKIFGQNFWWPGRFFPILATITSIIVMAAVARKIWGSSEGWFALFLGSTSPFLLSFGKIIQFETLLLCVSLIFTFISLDYLKKPSVKLKNLLIILSLIGSLIDWPFFIFIILAYLMLFHKSKVQKLGVTFVLISFFTLVLYYVYTAILTGPKDLISAYFGRSLGSELFGQKQALLKFTGLLLVRLIVYFSPLAVICSLGQIFKKKLPKIILLYLLFGGFNVLLFLNGAFAHPYWLYYLTPFFILASCTILSKIVSAKSIYRFFAVVLIIVNFAFALIIITFKDLQIKKALWQNDFIDQVSVLTKEQEIGTSWDFNEELYRYKTGQNIDILWSKEEIIKNTVNSPKWKYFIFSCWSNCTPQDAIIGEILEKKFSIALKEKEGRATLYDLSKPQKQTSIPNLSPTTTQTSGKAPKSFIFYYRKLRDVLGVNQI